MTTNDYKIKREQENLRDRLEREAYCNASFEWIEAIHDVGHAHDILKDMVCALFSVDALKTSKEERLSAAIEELESYIDMYIDKEVNGVS